MSKETLSLATRYAGNSSVISEMQTALDVMPLVTEAVQSVCERVECEPTGRDGDCKTFPAGKTR